MATDDSPQIILAQRGLALALGQVTPPAQGLVFQDSFDAQADWTSGLPENNTGAFPVNGAGPDREQFTGTHTLPTDWYAVRQDPIFAPSVGYPGFRENLSILDADSALARNGTGKCLVSTRDARQTGDWSSDGQLWKYLEPGHDSLYVEFWIAFSPNWTIAPSEDASKLFRIGSWSGVGSPFQAFSGGEEGPLFLWDWQRGTFGVRNVQTLRGGPWGDNYTLTDPTSVPQGEYPQTGSWPRGSMNFTTDTAGMGVGGTTPQIPDKVNGGYISDNLSQTVEHQQIFGQMGEYTKIAFYVAMNSAPGVQDGVLMQWLDDVQILNVRDVMWVPSVSAGQAMPKWNFFSLGGNDFFRTYPESAQRQEYTCFDDVLVRTDIPQGLANG